MFTSNGKYEINIKRSLNAGTLVNAFTCLYEQPKSVIKARLIVRGRKGTTSVNECWVWQNKHENGINAV